MLLRAIPENEQQLDFLSSLKTFKGNLRVCLFIYNTFVCIHDTFGGHQVSGCKNEIKEFISFL